MFLCEKNNEICRKSPKKICRNGDFRHISAFSAGKKFFSKIGHSHILGIANTRLCAKNQEKQMMKSREMPKNRFFRHNSGIFGRKESFSKIGLPHILGIAILHQCAKFHEKIYKVQLEKFKKYRFSGENRLFRRFLESSGLRKSVLLTIEPFLMVGIVIVRSNCVNIAHKGVKA